MTNKTKRQRGSRTHGGGSQKNRRGAGNRGGRGNAGSNKHEMHDTPPLGKQGFTRHPDLQRDITEVSLAEIDIFVYYEVGTPAEIPDTPVRVSAKEVVDDVDPNDMVKVLGDGRKIIDSDRAISTEITFDGGVDLAVEVVADQFSRSAIDRIEANGVKAIIDPDTYEEGLKRLEERIENMDNHEKEFVLEKLSKVEGGDTLSDDELERLLVIGHDHPEAISTICYKNYVDFDELGVNDIEYVLRFKTILEDEGYESPGVNRLIEEYFSDIDFSENIIQDLTEGMPDSIPVAKLNDILKDRKKKIQAASQESYPSEDPEARKERIDDYQKQYLYLVKDRLSATN